MARPIEPLLQRDVQITIILPRRHLVYLEHIVTAGRFLGILKSPPPRSMLESKRKLARP